MKIIWSKSSLKSYEQTIYFILENWPIEIAEQLETEVNLLLQKLSKNKNLCPKSLVNKSLRKCFVSKQTSLIYQVYDDKIELLLFIDNRSDHLF